MELERTLHSVPDDELLRRTGELVAQKRRVEADLVAHIGEIDERRLYARFATSSMFGYCTRVLQLSEAGAYRRITVARAARQHPMLLSMLRDGRVHLSALAALVSHLTPQNRDLILARATHASRREIEALVAELSPRPDAPSRIRKLPEPGRTSDATVAAVGRDLFSQASPEPEACRGAGIADFQLSPGRVGCGGTGARSDWAPAAPQGVGLASARALAPCGEATAQAVPARPHRREASVEALSPGRYRVQFTAGVRLRDKLERLTALLRSEVADGDLATIVELAVTEKLKRLEARRFARVAAPRRGLETSNTHPATRHIPAAVRRAVHARDEGRCRFVDEDGRRCPQRHALEFHHRHPFPHGGDHSLGNISLLCPTHNRYVAEHDYGRAAIRKQVAKSAEIQGRSPARAATVAPGQGQADHRVRRLD